MPRIRAAASSSFRRSAPSSCLDETFRPDVFPASPSVAQKTVQRTPAAAYFANVPPPENVSSSGWAYTPVSARSLLPVAAQQSQNREENIEKVDIDAHGRGHVIVGPVRIRPQDAPRIEDEQAAEDEHRAAGEPE